MKLQEQLLWLYMRTGSEPSLRERERERERERVGGGREREQS